MTIAAIRDCLTFGLCAGKGGDTMRRIGILGGTFDPVHNGHLLLGEQAYREYGLDEIWFMPSHVPPHKKDHLITDLSLIHI